MYIRSKFIDMPSHDCISAIIITRNEEHNIARCLDSLPGVADEIIVIDSFSTDNTPVICKSYDIKFIQKQWMGYAETKNFGISLAAYQYILSIDADEELSDRLREEVRNLKDGNFTSDAYRIKRLTNYCGKWIYHCGWYPDYKIRLWKKDRGQWKGIIHEEVDLANGSSITSLHGDLLHYSYYSINEHIQQMIGFTDLMAEDLFQKGKKVSILKIIFSPIVKFFKSYFIRGGFREGFYGLVICSLSSMATFLKYSKLYQFMKKKVR
jgi:glycosyltransferase involved in cell wall biosynthesis